MTVLAHAAIHDKATTLARVYNRERESESVALAYIAVAQPCEE